MLDSRDLQDLTVPELHTAILEASELEREAHVAGRNLEAMLQHGHQLQLWLELGARGECLVPATPAPRC
jgi:hypothetical protein